MKKILFVSCFTLGLYSEAYAQSAALVNPPMTSGQCAVWTGVNVLGQQACGGGGGGGAYLSIGDPLTDSATPLTSGSLVTIQSLTLTPGDWDCQGTVVLGGSVTGESVTFASWNIVLSTGTGSGINPSFCGGTGWAQSGVPSTAPSIGGATPILGQFPTGSCRFLVTTNTLISLSVLATISASSGEASGALYCRNWSA